MENFSSGNQSPNEALATDLSTMYPSMTQQPPSPVDIPKPKSSLFKKIIIIFICFIIFIILAIIAILLFAPQVYLFATKEVLYPKSKYPLLYEPPIQRVVQDMNPGADNENFSVYEIKFSTPWKSEYEKKSGESGAVYKFKNGKTIVVLDPLKQEKLTCTEIKNSQPNNLKINQNQQILLDKMCSDSEYETKVKILNSTPANINLTSSINDATIDMILVTLKRLLVNGQIYLFEKNGLRGIQTNGQSANKLVTLDLYDKNDHKIPLVLGNVTPEELDYIITSISYNPSNSLSSSQPTPTVDVASAPIPTPVITPAPSTSSNNIQQKNIDGLLIEIRSISQTAANINAQVNFKNTSNSIKEVKLTNLQMHSQTRGTVDPRPVYIINLSSGEEKTFDLSFQKLPDPPFEFWYFYPQDVKTVIGTYTP